MLEDLALSSIRKRFVMLEDFNKRTKLLLKSFFFLLIYPLFKNALLFASKRQGVLGKTSRRFLKRPSCFARVNFSIKVVQLFGFTSCSKELHSIPLIFKKYEVSEGVKLLYFHSICSFRHYTLILYRDKTLSGHIELQAKIILKIHYIHHVNNEL